ncbi:MAG: metallophosphoesterase family protein, partial [bacterium]|nr:metallophosphoesterase family protein [bacterium]
QQLKNESCDRHLFLGDICGYYYHQNEIIDILKDIPNLDALAGNHDVMFLESIGNEAAMARNITIYGHSFPNLKETISPGSLEYLKRLKTCVTLDEYNIAAFHGSPWNPVYEYVYPDAFMDRFDELSYQVVFLGHTHYPMDIQRKRIRIINPGSAGQPRDGHWPSYAVYHTKTRQAKIKRVTYDVDALIADVKEKDNGNPYLTEVLERIER